jgi:hypothetical protein
LVYLTNTPPIGETFQPSNDRGLGLSYYWLRLIDHAAGAELEVQPLFLELSMLPTWQVAKWD